MNLTSKRQNILVLLVILLTLATVAALAFRFAQRALVSSLEATTESATAMWSHRIGSRIESLVENAQWSTRKTWQSVKGQGWIPAVRSHYENHSAYFATSLYRKLGNDWKPALHLTQKRSAPEVSDFELLFRQYPAHDVEKTVHAIQTAKGAKIIRIYVPDNNELTVIDLAYEKFESWIGKESPHFGFLIDGTDRVLWQTDPAHFEFAEKVSYLPSVLSTRSKKETNRLLTEIPGGPEHVSHSKKISNFPITLFVQTAMTPLDALQLEFIQQIAIAMAVGLLTVFGTFYIVDRSQSNEMTPQKAVRESNYDRIETSTESDADLEAEIAALNQNSATNTQQDRVDEFFEANEKTELATESGNEVAIDDDALFEEDPVSETWTTENEDQSGDSNHAA